MTAGAPGRALAAGIGEEIIAGLPGRALAAVIGEEIDSEIGVTFKVGRRTVELIGVRRVSRTSLEGSEGVTWVTSWVERACLVLRRVVLRRRRRLGRWAEHFGFAVGAVGAEEVVAVVAAVGAVGAIGRNVDSAGDNGACSRQKVPGHNSFHARFPLSYSS